MAMPRREARMGSGTPRYGGGEVVVEVIAIEYCGKSFGRIDIRSRPTVTMKSNVSSLIRLQILIRDKEPYQTKF